MSHSDQLQALRVYAESYDKPVAVAEFEPLDAVHPDAHRQLDEGRCEVENQYGQAVPWEKPASSKGSGRVFELRPYFSGGAWALLPVGAETVGGICGLRRRAALLHARRAGGGPQGLPVWGRSLEGRAQAPRMQVISVRPAPERPLRGAYGLLEGLRRLHYNFGRKSYRRSRSKGRRDERTEEQRPRLARRQNRRRPQSSPPRMGMSHGAGETGDSWLIEALLLPILSPPSRSRTQPDTLQGTPG